MTIMAVTAMAVAGVSVALANAYEDTQDFYQCIQGSRSAMLRIQKIVRNARLITAATSDSLVITAATSDSLVVTAATSDSLVVWATDSDGSGSMSLSELTIFAYEQDAREICQYNVEFPSTMSESTKTALDKSISLAEAMDTSAITRDIKRHRYCATKILAMEVEAFDIKVTPAPPMSNLVRIQLTVSTGDSQSVTLRSASSTRSAVTEYVGTADGEYVVSIPERLTNLTTTNVSN